MNESAEKKQKRLATNNAYKKKRNDNETAEQRKERLAKEAAQRKARRDAAKLAKSQNHAIATFKGCKLFLRVCPTRADSPVEMTGRRPQGQT